MRRIIEIKRVIEWFFQRVTGVILVIGLTLHFYAMHFSSSGGITHDAILVRLSSPYWITFNIIFLLAAIYHGFNGLLGIMLEYVHSEKLQKALEGLLIVVAASLFALGIYILIGNP